jgi:hypothetical protein
MSRRQQQSNFVRALGLLISHAYFLGYELTFADGQSFPAHKRHRKGSFHFKRLAQDINLFKNGRYLRSTEAHRPHGEYWESIGGTWGGRWGDGNHYSWGEH